MKILNVKFLIILILAVSLILPLLAQATTPPTDSTPISSGVQKFGSAAFGSEQPTNIFSLIAKVINAALGILGIVFVILMIYGGYTWMTAMGTEEKIKKAKAVITQAVIGLVIIISAYAISSYVLNALYYASQGDGGTPQQVISE
ncbi:MAG: pilin [Candidatus Parcubacteria bacterium]|nr:pilin [Candidatus Parcubacteria bacterium]